MNQESFVKLLCEGIILAHTQFRSLFWHDISTGIDIDNIIYIMTYERPAMIDILLK